MPLSATLNGCPVYSVLSSDAEWQAIRAASKAATGALRMRCCPTDAVAKVSLKGLQFFAHKGKRPESCEWQPVSEEHETLKAVAARTVHARPGWRAGIEEAEENWRADVLAQRGRVRIAIEIQLSPQSNAGTSDRNLRVLGSAVVPIWLKGSRNHDNDFGDSLQERILGDDLEAQAYSVEGLVTHLLANIERQIEMARAVRDVISELEEWTYESHYFSEIPAWYALNRGDKKQTILLGELGSEILPYNPHSNPRESAGADEFAGAIIQMRMQSEPLRGYGCYGFRIDEHDAARSARHFLRPILLGHRRWMGRTHKEPVPGSFVHYPEGCPHCATKFLRITHAVIGNPRFPAQMPMKIESQDFAIMRALSPSAERLAKRLNLPLGPFRGEVASDLYPARPASQSCPQCGSFAPAPLVSDDEAALWPDRKPHFTLLIPMPGKGWMPSLVWKKRSTGGVAQWNALMLRKHQKREEEQEAERRKLEEDRKRRETEAAERRQKADEERAREAAKRKVREEAWQREEAERREQERMRQAERRQGALTKAAEKSIGTANYVTCGSIPQIRGRVHGILLCSRLRVTQTFNLRCRCAKARGGRHEHSVFANHQITTKTLQPNENGRDQLSSENVDLSGFSDKPPPLITVWLEVRVLPGPPRSPVVVAANRERIDSKQWRADRKIS